LVLAVVDDAHVAEEVVERAYFMVNARLHVTGYLVVEDGVGELVFDFGRLLFAQVAFAEDVSRTQAIS
jgi:hypothetical protein